MALTDAATLARTRDAASDAARADTLAVDAGAAPAASATRTRGGTVLPRVQTRDGQIHLVNEPRMRFEAERVLGEGGMGVVTLVHDHDIDRRVALKQIRSEVGDRALARFAEEVRTIGSLEHPNIVPIHDVGVDEAGDYYFVMKYVEGETLEDIITKLAAGDRQTHARFPFEVRVQIFTELLRALAYAHERGILHRDIKPANVMVGRYGEVSLMDWGIARPVGGADVIALAAAESEATVDESAPRRRLVQTADHALVGTPAYMSPEQARGAELDARSDLYSACVVFHELMTLRHYLDGRESVPAILLGVMTAAPPVCTRVSEIAHPAQSLPPMEYMHFLNRGMRKAPGERWQSAEEMIGELERAMEGRVRIQCPVTFTKRIVRETGRIVDRFPRLTVTVVCGAAGLTVLGAIGGAIAMLF